jgi:hypothetical protein
MTRFTAQSNQFGLLIYLSPAFFCSLKLPIVIHVFLFIKSYFFCTPLLLLGLRLMVYSINIDVSTITLCIGLLYLQQPYMPILRPNAILFSSTSTLSANIGSAKFCVKIPNRKQVILLHEILFVAFFSLRRWCWTKIRENQMSYMYYVLA